MTEQNTFPNLTHLLRLPDNQNSDYFQIGGLNKFLSILTGKHTSEFTGTDGFNIIAMDLSRTGKERTGILVSVSYESRYSSVPSVVTVTTFVGGESEGSKSYIIDELSVIPHDVQQALELVWSIAAIFELVSSD